MPEELQDVNEQAQPVQPEGVESTSPADEQPQETEASEAATPQEAVTQPVQEEQRVPYDRFKDVVEEKNYYKTLLEKQISQPQVPKAPEPDPYAGLTAEERLFYQNQEKMMRKIAEETTSKVQQQTQAQIQAAQAEFARMKVNEFRRQHPDIKPNSSEESEVARLIQVGYDPDHAYWAVMGPRGIQNVQHKVQRQVKQQIQAKKRANVETTSVQSSGLLPKAINKDSWRSDFEQDIEAAGGFDAVIP